MTLESENESIYRLFLRENRSTSNDRFVGIIQYFFSHKRKLKFYYIIIILYIL